MKLPSISRDTVAAVGTAVGQATISALVARHVLTADQGLSYTATVVSFFVGYRTRNNAQVRTAAGTAVADAAPELEKAVPAPVVEAAEAIVFPPPPPLA